MKLLAIVQRQGGTILARTLYELSDGRHVNVIFEPDGLRAFETEWPQCVRSKLDGADVRILPLDRIISSKKAAGRDKDLLAIPVLEKTLRVKARRRTRARRA